MRQIRINTGTNIMNSEMKVGFENADVIADVIMKTMAKYDVDGRSSLERWQKIQCAYNQYD